VQERDKEREGAGEKKKTTRKREMRGARELNGKSIRFDGGLTKLSS